MRALREEVVECVVNFARPQPENILCEKRSTALIENWASSFLSQMVGIQIQSQLPLLWMYLFPF